jgi:hypothetical protein
MAKVLAADVPEMDARIRECLPDHEIVFVRTLVEAVAMLRQDGFSLVVIGLHFDESRMFELLSHVRSLSQYDQVPVICVQGLEVIVPEAVMRTVDMAVKALGGTAFVDLRDEALDFREHCDFLNRAAGKGPQLRAS